MRGQKGFKWLYVKEILQREPALVTNRQTAVHGRRALTQAVTESEALLDPWTISFSLKSADVVDVSEIVETADCKSLQHIFNMQLIIQSKIN